MLDAAWFIRLINRKGNIMKLKNVLAAAILLALTNTGRAAAQPSCGEIDAAISATEDFAEKILGGDASAAKSGLAALDETFAAVRASLTADAAKNIEDGISAAKIAAQKGNPSAAAVAAMDAYRGLAAAFQNRLPTTIDVAMLDYAGFRLHGLLAAGAPDWALIEATVAEAGINWSRSAKNITDAALGNLGDSVQSGLEAAVAAKDQGWLGSMAKIQLDLVDLLERAVKNKAKGACK